jgi:hypothetical protein
MTRVVITRAPHQASRPLVIKVLVPVLIPVLIRIPPSILSIMTIRTGITGTHTEGRGGSWASRVRLLLGGGPS